MAPALARKPRQAYPHGEVGAYPTGRGARSPFPSRNAFDYG
jgi:hypothetical protein